jgi:predicted membrane protein
MNKTNIPLIILFIVLLICLGALALFWHEGKLSYEKSAAPIIVEFMTYVYSTYAMLIWIFLIMVFLLIFVFLFFKLQKRTKRQLVNVKVMRNLEKHVLSGSGEE